MVPPSPYSIYPYLAAQHGYALPGAVVPLNFRPLPALSKTKGHRDSSQQAYHNITYACSST